MIASLYQIDFVHAAGTLRLVDYGEKLTNELDLNATQPADTYAPINAGWGETAARGGAMSAFLLGVVRDHASHAALRGFCFSQTASMPNGRTGTLQISIQGGGTWQMASVSILTATTIPRIPSAFFETITTLTFSGGKMLPTSAMTLYAGVPYEFILQSWSALSGAWNTY